MVDALFTDTVVRLRPGSTTDRYNNAIEDWDAASSLVISGVSVQPATQVETADGTRDTVNTSWVLRNPIDAGDLDITTTDRITYAGMTLEVDGEVLRWPGLLEPGVSCVQVQLRRRVDL